MINKEKELLKNLGYFYRNVLGAKQDLFFENMSLIISGILLPSFNFCFISGNLQEKELKALEKTWRGPMILVTDMEKNFTHQKHFYHMGFQKYISFPILYKRLLSEDFIWGNEQIQNVQDIEIKRVSNSSELKDFSNVVSKVFNMDSKLIIKAMKKNIINEESSNLYVGYHNKKPICTVASLNHENKSFIWNMTILPEFRQSNLMKKMGYKMFEDNFEKNILDTYTFTTTEETEGLFKKMGAKEVGSVYLWIRQ